MKIAVVGVLSLAVVLPIITSVTQAQYTDKHTDKYTDQYTERYTQPYTEERDDDLAEEWDQTHPPSEYGFNPNPYDSPEEQRADQEAWNAARRQGEASQDSYEPSAGGSFKEGAVLGLFESLAEGFDTERERRNEAERLNRAAREKEAARERYAAKKDARQAENEFYTLQAQGEKVSECEKQKLHLSQLRAAGLSGSSQYKELEQKIRDCD